MTSKGTEQQQPKTECCMCGDLGFSDQLFQCKICQFRSQHRYCSNLYPKIEFFGTCNWCLSPENSPNSSNSSSSYKKNMSTEDEGKNKIIKGSGGGGGGSASGGRVYHLQLLKHPMKKQNSPSEKKSPLASTSPSILVSTRKRIITNGALEEKLRRTRSKDIIKSSNSIGATKLVFRNKVRRYKLLDEVSS
ncbi:hypothetical protein TSUD_217320 [Trifolium subterraneum]|uniref:PHD-type zinc finger plants domain-containing protein n=1 Tax=Trifolium subterraneum TaxID=3900 RepID=A0A2Z6NCM1_TRISU|nr:hypothetical protein TSUD_217320 [Trifolium subterraneum]